MIPEGNPFHCRASFLSIISNHAFAPCSLSIFRFFKEETLAARAPLALEADLFGLHAKPFIFEKHDIPTVAILAQGTLRAVALAAGLFFVPPLRAQLAPTAWQGPRLRRCAHRSHFGSRYTTGCCARRRPFFVPPLRALDRRRAKLGRARGKRIPFGDHPLKLERYRED